MRHRVPANKPSKGKKAKTKCRLRSTKWTKTKKRKDIDKGYSRMTSFHAFLIDEFKATRTLLEFANHREWMQALYEFLHEKDPEIIFSDLLGWIENHEWISTFGEGETRKLQPWSAQFETLPNAAGARSYNLLENTDADNNLSYMAPDSPETVEAEAGVEYKTVTIIVDDLSDLEGQAENETSDSDPHRSAEKSAAVSMDQLDLACARLNEMTTSTTSSASSSIGSVNQISTAALESAPSSNSAVPVSNHSVVALGTEEGDFDKALVPFNPNALSHAEIPDPIPSKYLRDASPHLVRIYKGVRSIILNDKIPQPPCSIGNNSKADKIAGKNACDHNLCRKTRMYLENGNCVNGSFDSSTPSTSRIPISPSTNSLVDPRAPQVPVVPQMESATQPVSGTPLIQQGEEQSFTTLMETEVQRPPTALQLCTTTTAISTCIQSASNSTTQFDVEKPGTLASFYNQRSLPIDNEKPGTSASFYNQPPLLVSNGRQLPLCSPEQNAFTPIDANTPVLNAELANDEDDPDDEIDEWCQIELAMDGIDKILQISNICKVLDIRSGPQHLTPLCNAFQRYKRNLITEKLESQRTKCKKARLEK